VERLADIIAAGRAALAGLAGPPDQAREPQAAG
jgi:hypothetical protein